jgi:hypothetical protein
MAILHDDVSALKFMLNGADDSKEALKAGDANPETDAAGLAAFATQEISLLHVTGAGVVTVAKQEQVTIPDPGDADPALAVTVPVFKMFSDTADTAYLVALIDKTLGVPRSLDISMVAPPIFADIAKIKMQVWTNAGGPGWTDISPMALNGNDMLDGNMGDMNFRSGEAGMFHGDMFDQGGDFAAGGVFDMADAFGIPKGVEHDGFEFDHGDFSAGGGTSALSSSMMKDHLQLGDLSDMVDATFFPGTAFERSNVYAVRWVIDDAGGLGVVPLWTGEGPVFNMGDTITRGGWTIFENPGDMPVIPAALTFHDSGLNDAAALNFGGGWAPSLPGMAFNPASGTLLWSFRIFPGMARQMMIDVQWYSTAASANPVELQVKSGIVGQDADPSSDAGVLLSKTTSESTRATLDADKNYMETFIFELSGDQFQTGAMVYLELACTAAGDLNGPGGDRIHVLGAEALCKVWKQQ